MPNPTRAQIYNRLANLHRVVEAVPPEKLWMPHFVRVTECGTVYCAAGWAGVDPWFNANGFTLDNNLGSRSFGTFKDECGMQISPQVFWGLIPEIYEIFYPGHTVTKSEVLGLIKSAMKAYTND